MSKGNKMLINRIAVIGLAVVAAATQAGVPPVKFFYRDTVPVSITLDEPATGCSMVGVIVHPVDRPAAKVAWFSERICGKKRYPVSFISDEISAPHNVIHKGEKFHVTPAQVNLLDAQNL
ncbi:hypothetical protein ASV33_24335 [Enterobacter hormaechei subsp. xiangfangensis]|nr:hypothetical protein ASV34_24375 [Enterobacter hormaechei subsp. xiangfangensis]HAS1743234.1 hypothetical protein [Enterobacter hormaechei subsp. oharae]KTH07636.1 hypothetical protein ASV33_24335 [Enterobacter hormaechei subsp. xiangfangensis]KTI00652.1 hypothetical protein ASV12_16175 [Enterobacter hormaechei subsp. xiangfangensis]KTI90324.1 hypothetical protein ASU94_25085 [Enterobacter hormaechei subsp. xiangfangensis]